MDNYKNKLDVNLKNGNVEINEKRIIPLSDFRLIKKIEDNYNKDICYIETSDREQFDNIKSLFDIYISYQEYEKYLKELGESIEKAIDSGDVFENNPLDNMPLLEIMSFFVSPIIELVIDNKVIDGIYKYTKISDKDIEDILFYFNEYHAKSFICFMSICRVMNNGYTNGLIAFYSFQDALKFNKKNKEEKRTYIMQDISGYYKIGRSIDPVFRQYQFKTGNITIKLLFYIEGDRELELHRIFASKQIEREWYNLNKKDLKFIRNYNNIRKNHPEYIINKRL